MERPNWVSRPTIKRADRANWPAHRVEPLGSIIRDHSTHEVREEMMHELWGRYGNVRTFGKFVERIKTQEGLIDPRKP